MVDINTLPKTFWCEYCEKNKPIGIKDVHPENCRKRKEEGDNIDIEEALAELIPPRDFSKDPDYTKCNACDQWELKKNIRGHFAECRTKSDKYIKCEFCNSYQNKSWFARHLNEKHKDEEKTLTYEAVVRCEECKEYINKRNIGWHRNKVHGKKIKRGVKVGKKDTKRRGKDKKKRKPKNNDYFITFQKPIKHSVARLFDRYKRTPRAIVRWRYKWIPQVRWDRRTGRYVVYMGEDIRAKVKYKTFNMPKKRRQFCFGYVISNEWGVLREKAHCHAYIKGPVGQKKATDINKLRLFVKKHLKPIGDLQQCGVPKKTITYVSKEDVRALVRDVDRELLHNDWQMYQIAVRLPDWDLALNEVMYQARKWGNQFQLNKFRRMYDAVRMMEYKKARVEGAEKHYRKSILEKLSPSKKGIWLYGKPGCGKTSTVVKYTKGEHFEMPKVHNQFIFNTWKYDQDIIVFEDESRAKMIALSRTINTLTDDNGMHMGERKGGDHFGVRVRKCIITSNDEPPTEEEWPGFTRRFDVIHAVF